MTECLIKMIHVHRFIDLYLTIDVHMYMSTIEAAMDEAEAEVEIHETIQTLEAKTIEVITQGVIEVIETFE